MATPETPRRLGRGLDALLARRDPKAATPADASEGVAADPAATSAPAGSALQTVPINAIKANPFQPRREFAEADLRDLEASLKANGLLQPVTVRPSPDGNGYELIAGERRLRAATRLGWAEIPAVVRATDDRDALTLALVENLQRADLDPVEESDGYQRLIEEFALSQQEVADVVGKERSTVANALRLRQLPPAVRELLQAKKLSAGHARALLPLGTAAAITALANEVVQTGMSVRETERRVQGARGTPPVSGRKASPTTGRAHETAESRRLEELLRKRLQTKVSLHLTAKNKGEVRIVFLSNDDLERVLDVLGVQVND